jgi:hypothetical protein
MFDIDDVHDFMVSRFQFFGNVSSVGGVVETPKKIL